MNVGLWPPTGLTACRNLGEGVRTPTKDHQDERIEWKLIMLPADHELRRISCVVSYHRIIFDCITRERVVLPLLQGTR